MAFGVQAFYAQRDYQPFWTRTGVDEGIVSELLYYIADAHSHGIHPDKFNYGQIVALLDSLKNHKVQNDDSILHGTLMDMELLLTRSYLQYAKALRYGIADPKVVNGGKWLYDYEKPDTLFVKKALEALSDVKAAMADLQVTDKAYQRYQEELASWRERPQAPDTIPLTMWYKHATDPSYKTLCQRLKWLGNLSENVPDTNCLTAKVLAAVNDFRTDNAIPTLLQVIFYVASIRRLSRNSTGPQSSI